MSTAPRSFALLAELTHRCPLRCPYCSNGLQLTGKSSELSTAEWSRTLREAAAMGVLHVFFSGGEPLLRADLGELVQVARQAGLYSNLITSAYGLNRQRLADHIPRWGGQRPQGDAFEPDVPHGRGQI